MHRQEACNYKQLYDTEFEAQRAAAKMERRVEEQFHHYPCGNHWHIAHTDPTLRNKHVKILKDHCDLCGCNMKPERYMKHLKTQGHQRKEREQANVRPEL
jgi:hypothetical protein